jgi:hypothetical protein
MQERQGSDIDDAKCRCRCSVNDVILLDIAI